MADPFQLPEDLKGKSLEDIAQMYVQTRDEYGKFKGEWEPRAKTWESYSKLGKPEELEQVVTWGKTFAPVAEQLRKGELHPLNDADWKAYQNWATETKNGTARQPVATPDDDIFAPVRDQLSKQLEEKLNGIIEERAKGFQGQLQAALKSLQDQMNLFGRVEQFRHQYPNAPLDEILKEASDWQGLPVDQQLERMIQSRLKAASFDAEVAAGVAKELEKRTAATEADTAKVLVTNRQPGSLPLGKPTREDTARNLVTTLNQKWPDLLRQIPLT